MDLTCASLGPHHPWGIDKDLSLDPTHGYRFKHMEISIPGTEEDLTSYSYPPEAVQVRNTFIHVSSPGQPAPTMVSCPARQVGKIRELWQDEDSQSASSSSKMVICLEDSLFPTMPGTPEQVGIFEPRQVWEADWQGLAPPPPNEPAPGTAELPSIGSRGHSKGECKPCAFMYAKGCKNGALCAFCHLCDRTEKKRRQKAKKMMYTGGA
eukprot:Skav207374  [mRNA]  locus=scaffold2496:15726:25682:+ [translate_table: standard]